MLPCPVPPPRRFTAIELARVGVAVVGAEPIRLECRRCGAQWYPRVGPDGRIEDRYWVCVACRTMAG